MTHIHLAYYSRIAVLFYAYHCLDLTPNIQRADIFHKLAYAFRFATTELLNLKSLSPSSLVLDWTELNNRSGSLPDIVRTGVEIVGKTRNEGLEPTGDLIDLLFNAFASVHNACVDSEYLQRSS